MNKQKAAAPNDPNIKTPKIRKIATPSCSQTQPKSQSINYTQVIDPTPVLNDDFERLTQIWNSAKKNELNVPQDQLQVEYTEVKDQIAQAIQKIETLHIKLIEDKQENEKMAKYIEGKYEQRKEIIQNQDAIASFHSQIQVHTDAIIETKKHCEETRQRVVQVYSNTSLKQQEIIKKLAQELNDKIINKKMEFKKQMELKRDQILNLEIVGLKPLEKEIHEKRHLKNEMESRFEKSKSTLDENTKRYNQELNQLLEINAERESTLKFEKKEKYKLETEADEVLAKYDELHSKYKALQLENSEYESQMKNIPSSLLDLEEEQRSLNTEIDELKKNHVTLISNKDLELAEYKKQLQDLTLSHEEAIEKMKEKASTSEESSKNAAEIAADNEQLEKSLKNTNDEIANIGVNLSNLLDKNKQMDEDIEAQNYELITLEKNICDNKAMSKTYNTKQDEAAKRENEIITELAMIEQQLSNESEEMARLLIEERDQKIKSAERVKQLIRDIKETDELNKREKETIKDLKREIGQNESNHQKKIQEAEYAAQKCQSAGHEEQIKKQENQIDILNTDLSSAKLKRKQANINRNTIEVMEKKNHENQLKRMESHYEDLNKVLSALKAEYAVLLSESKKAKDDHLETVSACSTPKPILKSVARESPLIVQRVQFDLGPPANTQPINAMKVLERSERRFAALPIGNQSRPDWANIKIGKASEEPDDTSSIRELATPQTPKTRKFFKTSRLTKKKTFG